MATGSAEPTPSAGSSRTEILAGGQAVLEGVMMKLPRSWAVVVRRADGTVASRSGPHVPWTERWPVLKAPILRGVATLFSMMGLGMRALFFSSDVLARDEAAAEAAAAAEADGSAAGGDASSDEASSDGPETGDVGAKGKRRSRTGQLLTLSALALWGAVAEGPDGDEADGPAESDGGSESTDVGPTEETTTGLPDGGGMSGWELALSIAMAAGAFLLLFKALPLGVAWMAARAWEPLGSPLGESVISGVALALVFIAYLWGLSLIPDIRRVFQYHGAEHEVVWVHETGEPRTVEAARSFPTQHPRCGTSFLFFVVLTSIVVWSLFPVDWGFFGKLGLRLALFPLVVGLSFELIRLTARHRRNPFLRALMAPGLWSQRITTKRPDDGMLDVSLQSLALAEQAARTRR